MGIALISFLYYYYYFYIHRRPILPSNATTASRMEEESSVPEGNVWEERRRRGIPAASLHVKKDVTLNKPFGSSYYYAHNSTKTTGGYKDGLTMEDFTMNGPRLLRRHPVDDNETTTLVESTELHSERPDLDTPPRVMPSRTIDRYLWDDPGQGGVATLRIEGLQSSSSQLQPWSEIRPRVRHIAATRLPGGGLLVQIDVEEDATVVVRHSLRLATLYGPVDRVETVPTKKRLLVRLYKSRTSWWDASNLQAWPHPQKAAK